jgi:hypothetical protein
MSEPKPFNVTLEDDDGKMILPPEPEKHGNAFLVHCLPRKGDEVQVNDVRYTVIAVIHRLDPDFPAATISLRLKRIALDLGE